MSTLHEGINSNLTLIQHTVNNEHDLSAKKRA